MNRSDFEGPIDPVPLGNDLVLLLRNNTGNAEVVSARLFTMYQGLGTPLGTVATSPDLTANSSAVSATTDSGLIASFIAVAGRRYRTVVSVDWLGSTPGDVIEAVLTDGANTQLARQAWTVPVASSQTHIAFSYMDVPSPGSQTRKLRFGRNTGTGTVQLIAAPTQPGQLWVEDIGT